MVRRGFSLVEILVVIAIVMLLVAMVLPIMQTARQQAHKVTCASNLRQIGLSLEMYSLDYSGYFPKEEVMSSPIWTTWQMLLKPYIDKNQKKEAGYYTNLVHKCPADHDTYINAWSDNSYSYNSHLSLDNIRPRFFPYEVRAKIAVIVDGYAYFSIWGLNNRVYYRHDTRRIDNYYANGRTIHIGTCNALMGDLRIENVKDVTYAMTTWY
jgi:prepilin-type N-terminal cleavage/methylation domain-containing protein